jgi:hypothetical protein
MPTLQIQGRGRPGEGRNGMTQQDAVVAALEIVGDQTSIATLAKEATRIYGGTVSGSAASIYRGYWRRQNGVQRDNRTYVGQPRRDMLKDSRIELPQVRRIAEFFRRTRPTMANLLAMIDGNGGFHSIEQLKTALIEAQQLQIAA